jgi:hypothetical protein
MQTLDRASLDRRRRRVEAECAAPPLHPLLALQRGAGNHAVARAIAQRRTLARSCDEQDEAVQIAEHDAHFNAFVAQGQGLIDSVGAVRRPAAAGPATPAAPPPVPQARHAPPARYRFEADEDSVIHESDDEETEAEEPAPQVGIMQGPWFILPSGEIASLGMLLALRVPAEIIRRLPLLQLPVGEDAEMGDGDDDEGVLGRKVARNFNPDAARTKQSPIAKTFKFTGFPGGGDNPAALAAGVGATTKVKRRGLQNGTPTNKGTRPPDWWGFIPLVGMGPGIAYTRYIMGHLLNKNFGGRGDDMANLSVFSSRLNSHHKVQVEIPLHTFLSNTGGHIRTIDYTVTPVYGSPVGMIADAGAMFDNFLANNRKKALAAWVKLDLIDPADVANLMTAPVTSAVSLTKGGTWDVLVATWRAWALQYVTQHFPESIVCTARQYDRASAAATDWDKTTKMAETILHVA